VTAASGPFVILASWLVDDDTSGSSNGNDDGDADSGEHLEIRVRLSNEGIDAAYNVVATISTTDPYVIVQDGVENFGTIPPSVQLWSPDDFDVTIAGDCPDGHLLHLDLLITCDEPDSWEAAIDLTVEAPELTIAYVIVDDTAGGTGNGIPDPVESFNYHVVLRNDGSEDATDVSVELTSAVGIVQVLQGTAGATLIGPGEEIELTPVFGLAVSPYSPEPEIFDLDLALTADWSYATAFVQELEVGGFWDDVEAGEGNWTHAIGTPGFADEWHRSSQRGHTPGGGWAWKHGDTGTGDYANLSDGCLASEPVPLATTTRLSFWHWMEAETSSAHPDHCYDGGCIEIAIDGGAWEPLTPEGGYPYLIREGGTPGPFPAETPVYSGSHDWVAALFTLEAVTGTTAQFRFRFGSDGADTREGWYIDDVRVSGTSGGAADAPEESSQPLSLTPMLLQNRPNPFRPGTMIAFELPQPQPVRLAIFDAGGRLLRTLAAGPHEAGTHRISWNGRSDCGELQPSGIYYYRLETARGEFTRSMTLVH